MDKIESSPNDENEEPDEDLEEIKSSDDILVSIGIEQHFVSDCTDPQVLTSCDDSDIEEKDSKESDFSKSNKTISKN